MKHTKKYQINCRTCGKRKFLPRSRRKERFCSHKCVPAWNKGKKRTWTSFEFTKGHIPVHKGKTKIDYPKLSNSGVKKGNIPWNYKGWWIENGYKVLSLANGKRKFEHRYIMEQFLGRELLSNEIVHHVNHDKLDNRIQNLQILTRKEHPTIHNRYVKS